MPDSLDAAARATRGRETAAEVAEAAKAVDDAMDAPRRKGRHRRARIFADRSAGMDDPGMPAMNRIVRALADREG